VTEEQRQATEAYRLWLHNTIVMLQMRLAALDQFAPHLVALADAGRADDAKRMWDALTTLPVGGRYDA